MHTRRAVKTKTDERAKSEKDARESVNSVNQQHAFLYAHIRPQNGGSKEAPPPYSYKIT